jgi:hypothetical protein
MASFAGYMENRKVESLFVLLGVEWAMDNTGLEDPGGEKNITKYSGLWHCHSIEGKDQVDCIWIENIDSGEWGEDTPDDRSKPDNCIYCDTPVPKEVYDAYEKKVRGSGT